jgi:hypothetical protein
MHDNTLAVWLNLNIVTNMFVLLEAYVLSCAHYPDGFVTC